MHIANDNKITASYHEHRMQWHAEQVPSCVHHWHSVQWIEFHCNGIMYACMQLLQDAASADSSDATDVVVNFCENDVV